MRTLILLSMLLLTGCNDNAYHRAQRMCFAAGYPEVRIVGDFRQQYFCLRRVAGSDQVMEVKP